MKTNASQEDIKSASKLKTRVSSNNNSSKDFDEWCFQQFPQVPLKSNVLDLGCGNGKQLHLFSRIFSKKTKFVGLDLSKESLDELKSNYNSAPRLKLIKGSFDKMNKHGKLKENSFDLIYAVYALYYTQNLKSLVKAIYKRLKKGGTFWVIGPDTGTNNEFLEILRPLHEVEPFMDYVFDDFMPEVVSHAADAGFRKVKPSTLRNKVFFPDSDAFLNYLSNSLFYREGHDEEIRKQVDEVVKKEGTFAVSKNIMSLQFKK